MANLNALIRERKSLLRQLKANLRKVDSRLEISQRSIDRMLKRKRNVPDMTDYQKMVDDATQLNTSLEEYIYSLEQVGGVWQG